MITIDNSEVKVLIVDDTTENLEIAGKILAKEGYDIYIADSGQTALELVGNVQFDIILLDIMMPVMDGFETCKRIKAIEEQENVPIIFLTAKVDVDSLVRGFDYGAVDYIRKPFSAMELVVRVKNHVELKKIREQLLLENKKLAEAYALQEVLATTDPLTKLFNRREMLNKIEYEKIRFERNKTPFTVLIGDIDYFKNVNDKYGHEGGDFVLRRIAEILKEGVRKQDFVARWGGEEFLLLLPDTTLNGGANLAEKLRTRIEQETFNYDNQNIKITMTLGISSFTGGMTIDELINMADKALYSGKQKRRNCVVEYKNICEQ